jgi:hypothetical protein
MCCAGNGRYWLVKFAKDNGLALFFQMWRLSKGGCLALFFLRLSLTKQGVLAACLHVRDDSMALFS